MALAGAAGAADEKGDLLVYEPAGREVTDEFLAELRVQAEVEAFQSLLAPEAGATDPGLELLLLPPGDFILDNQGEELGVGELALDGFPVTGRQTFQHAGQAQLLQ